MATCSRPSERPTHDFDAVKTTVRDDARVADQTHLDGTVEHRLYRIMWTTDMDGFLRALAEHDLIVEEAMETDTEWAFQLRAHDREPLAAFHTTCHDTGIPLDSQRVEHNSDDLDHGCGLTDKQHAALVVAVMAILPCPVRRS